MIAHEFQPISHSTRLEQAMEYVARYSGMLAQIVLGGSQSIGVVSLFTHSDSEYAFVERCVRGYGQKSRFSHGPTTYVEVELPLAGHRVSLLGVRQPDPSRPEVGYGDVLVDDYTAVRGRLQGNRHVREIASGRGQRMLEIRHHDFEVLAYVVEREEEDAAQPREHAV